MKRLLLIVLVLFISAGAFGQQNYTFDYFKSVAQDFASGVASSLPLDASVGLNWSDAYIGQFPHFGLGATLGAATIPISVVNNALKGFGASPLSNLGIFSNIGIPLPAYTIDARIGGFVLPFDIGLKFGYLPPNAFSSTLAINYLMAGGDIRYALLKDKGFVPGLSVGLGYTYMSGSVTVPGGGLGSINVQNVNLGGTSYQIGFTSPSMGFSWVTNVIDFKVQLSKNLFIITPYIGAGVSYGISNVGFSLQDPQMTFGPSGGPYNPITQSELNQINSAYGTNFSLSNPGLGINGGANGFSTRVFGGLSLNIWVLKIGAGVEYEFISATYAGMVNVRLQF
jgi:hypothetical protein